MTRIEFLDKNAAYMADECVAVIDRMSDEDFARLVTLDEELTGEGEPGIYAKIIVASGTVADFDAARDGWREKGEREALEDGVVYLDVQAVKGQQRRNLAVMNWDGRCVVLEAY